MTNPVDCELSRCACGHDARDHDERQGCMETYWMPSPPRNEICSCAEFRFRRPNTEMAKP